MTESDNGKMKSGFPAWPQIREQVEGFAEKNRHIARMKTIGQSAEGREVRAVFITDGAHPARDKEVVLIVFGRHGDELGTRAAALGLLEWLASESAADVLARQQIIVVPVANPDGCAKDAFGFPPDRLSACEKESVVSLGLSLVPDVVLDVHSVGREKYGYNWGGLEAVVVDETAVSGEDPYILRTLADEMIRGAAQKGYPFLLHSIGFYKGLKKKGAALSKGAYNNHVNQVFFDAFHALTFGVEVNHFILSPAETAQSGVAAIAALLKAGNTVFPWEHAPGYPNRILLGDFQASIRPRGKTAALRRASRQAIWSKRHLFSPAAPYRKMENPHCADLEFTYFGEEPLAGGLTLALRLRGRPGIRRVEANGTRLSPVLATDACSTFVFMDLDSIEPGMKNSVHIDF